MPEIVNLRRVRKRKERDVAAREADANRLLHGRTGADKAASRLTRRLEATRLDGHRRDPQDGSGGGDS